MSLGATIQKVKKSFFLQYYSSARHLLLNFVLVMGSGPSLVGCSVRPSVRFQSDIKTCPEKRRRRGGSHEPTTMERVARKTAHNARRGSFVV